MHLARVASEKARADHRGRASARRRRADSDEIVIVIPTDDDDDGARSGPATGRKRDAAHPGAHPRRPIMFVVWHEEGHLAGPAAIARRLQDRGERVVFAAAASFGPRLSTLGFETVDLSGTSDRGRRWTIFNLVPDRAALGEAVDRLVATFDAAVGRLQPSAILFDSRLAPLGIMAEAAGIPWATYEAKLASEHDPQVPPPGSFIVPDGTADTTALIGDAWRAELGLTIAARESALTGDPPQDWTRRHFGAVLVAELEHRLGKTVPFDELALGAPVPLRPRMILAPRALDFARGRSAHGTWVGGCIDERRSEAGFPWDQLPSDRPIAYCAFGTQSLRDPQAAAHLRAIVEAFGRRDDFFLVVACPAPYRPLKVDPRRLMWVEKAPQLALLRRASLAVTHAGYNTVKECATFGVRMIAVPLSHDQPRNAALVEHLGLGVAFPPDVVLGADDVDAAINRVRDSAAIHDGCARMQQAIAASDRPADALAFIDALVAGR